MDDIEQSIVMAAFTINVPPQFIFNQLSFSGGVNIHYDSSVPVIIPPDNETGTGIQVQVSLVVFSFINILLHVRRRFSDDWGN
jgi:hypothetical protein